MMPASKTSSATDRKGGPLGVCAAIGADFGFNPDILRVLLAAGLLWNPLVILGGYGFAALLMLTGRWLFPAAGPNAAVAPCADAVAECHAGSAMAAMPPERLAA